MNAPLQRTAEWEQERCGCATASQFSDVVAKVKIGEAATRRKYRVKILTERLTGNPVIGYQNGAMLWGIMTEPEARMAYEAARGALVVETGFLKHPQLAWCGASPDGLIGDEGMVEFKCPESTTHLEWLTGGIVPPEHVAQIQGQMWVSGRQWVDFVSYDPRFPEHLQLFIVRVARDEEYIKMLETEVQRFLGEINVAYEVLMRFKLA